MMARRMRYSRPCRAPDMLEIGLEPAAQIWDGHGLGHESRDDVGLAGTPSEVPAQRLVRSLADREHPGVAEDLGSEVVFHVAAAAEQLHQIHRRPRPRLPRSRS